MRRLLPTAGAVATTALLAASLHAQSPAPSGTQVKDEAHKTMMVTGCLEASASLPGFRLTNVVMDRESATSRGVPAIGTSGKTLTYEVSAKDGVDLSAHAGQKVTVTATQDETAQAAPQPPPQADPDAGGLKGPLPKLTVLSVKTVAASCS